MKNEMFEKISELQWLWHKRHIMRHAEGGVHADHTRGQGRIIALLKLEDGISTKDMSYLLGIQVSSLNETLAKLEKNGYITREPSEDDKRVMLVRLTEKGKTEERHEHRRGDAEALLSEEDRQTFCALADKVIAALRDELGIEGDEMKERMKMWHDRKREMRKFHGFGGRFQCDCKDEEKKEN